MHMQNMWIISSFVNLSFSIRDVAFQGTLPTPHALKPNICNNYFEANLTKVAFGNGGHCSAIITNLFHLCWALA